MLPVSDVIPSRTTPVATISLIAGTAAAFLYELQLDGEQLQALTSVHGVTPAAFKWPSVVTGLFLHAGWVHVAANLLWLWIFGDNVEDAVGRARFLLLYLACGAAAAAAYMTAHPWTTIPMIGASGAVAGVTGAYLVLYPRSRVLTAIFVVVSVDVVEIPAVFFVGIWFVLQLFSNVGSIGADAADGVLAFWANLAGFVTGALGGAYARFGAASLRRYWR